MSLVGKLHVSRTGRSVLLIGFDRNECTTIHNPGRGRTATSYTRSGLLKSAAFHRTRHDIQSRPFLYLFASTLARMSYFPAKYRRQADGNNIQTYAATKYRTSSTTVLGGAHTTFNHAVHLFSCASTTPRTSPTMHGLCAVQSKSISGFTQGGPKMIPPWTPAYTVPQLQ